MEHFCVKLGISCTAGVTYKVNPINNYESFDTSMFTFPNKYSTQTQLSMC